MAYLPFYITPEEFTELEDKRESEIREKERSLCWTSYNLNDKDRWLRKRWWLLGHSLVSALLIVMGMIADFEMWMRMEGLALATMIVIPVVGFVTYISYASDDRFDYVFSKRGTVVFQRFGEPDWVPAAVKGMGIIGSVGCIILVAVVGPAALVGLGGFMLVSFVLVSRKPHEPTRLVVPSEQYLIVKYNKKRNVICIFSKIDVCTHDSGEADSVFRVQTKGELYLFPESTKQFDEILGTLNENLSISVEQEDDLEAIFEREKRPQIVKAVRRAKATYSMEDAVNKRHLPTPPPKKPR
ncbi:hypothetical protein TW78_13810 [Vibrio coralliilyticus]|uniref:Uncharacterized protein n=1 Tax=Vibrio coralliilyticus TaxID=190893 RepID=A0A837G2P2_9VIBR|nr:hypothetical protein [Vibrio coralliilyticus]KJY71599.1 hypothetical protein TW78_13810 [Vibrio coralliilyticus]QOU32234.1 hypothetical protein TW71_023745 [Vibrio coralliilyticus]